MTSFVNRYAAQPGTSVTTLSAWDGRPTSALVNRSETVQPELLWLVWDLAPRYEIWLRVPVEQWRTKELFEPDLLSDFVARNAVGSLAVVEVFDPAPGARPAILLTTTMTIDGAPEDLAALVANRAREAFEKTRSEPAPPALADFAEVAAHLAIAR
ncbi:hypothetical protein GCM10010372_82300 [Streptomyces tauricus]|uniref:hypothetical protein n=1 Tax=Streptomyces tauricus TaxID=68274 RepID=UPI001678DE6F|nr:hypothetical protein [Streptomyces tauricus]GHA70669.1 hypothetical protein GCM10010372_82300 [Streptomyces tauricus]